MKILFIVNALKNGGAERVCSELASFFSKNNEVYILITSVRAEHAYSTGDAKIEYLNNGEYVSPLRKTHLCKRWMKKNKPDIVIAFPDPCSYYGAKAAKKMHIPCICSERNAPMFQPKGKIMRFMRNAAYRKATAVVFQTNEAKNWFPKSIQKKGYVIWNPYEDCSSSQTTICNRKKRAIITAGRIVEQKNHLLLVKAFKIFNSKYPDISLDIYGDGEASEILELERTINDLNLENNVNLKGFSKDLKSSLNMYDIFVLSSNHEGMPNALLEAAICGLTCVSTDCPVGGPREILSLCNAHYLVPCRDEKALGQALIKAFENREKNEECLRIYGQKIKDSVSIEKIGEKWNNLIDFAIKNNLK